VQCDEDRSKPGKGCRTGRSTPSGDGFYRRPVGQPDVRMKEDPPMFCQASVWPDCLAGFTLFVRTRPGILYPVAECLTESVVTGGAGTIHDASVPCVYCCVETGCCRRGCRVGWIRGGCDCQQPHVVRECRTVRRQGGLSPGAPRGDHFASHRPGPCVRW
jgi:hypothetical protein